MLLRSHLGQLLRSHLGPIPCRSRPAAELAHPLPAFPAAGAPAWTDDYAQREWARALSAALDAGSQLQQMHSVRTVLCWRWLRYE
jgi:hypothetical protein